MTELKQDEAPWEPVSKTIDAIYQRWVLRKNSGTVKFLRFEPDKAYPEHHHPDRTEWLYVDSGEIIAEIDGHVQNLKEGDHAEFPLNCRHSLKAGPNGSTVIAVALFEK